MEKKLLFILLLIPGILSAQEDYDQFVKEGDEAFEQFEREAEAEYQQFIKETDAEWAAYLRQTWEEYEVEDEEQKPEKPKPVSIPPVEQEVQTQSEQLELNEEEALVITDELVMPTNTASKRTVGSLPRQPIVFTTRQWPSVTIRCCKMRALGVRSRLTP